MKRCNKITYPLGIAFAIFANPTLFANTPHYNHALPPDTQFEANGLPILHSSINSKAQMYLDFSGKETGIKPVDFDGDPTTFNHQEQTYIYNWWRANAEYFAIFDLDVTTEIDTSRPHTWISISPKWGGGGAVSHLGYPKWEIAHAGTWFGPESTVIGHEGGHTLGMPHAIGLNLFGEKTQSYYASSNPLRGVTMGSGDYIQNKFNNKHAWARVTQYYDDISQASSLIKRYVPESSGFRPDDFADDLINATPLKQSGHHLSIEGIIETMDDVDTFTFDWQGGHFLLQVSAKDLSQANLKVMLFDSAENLVAIKDNGINHQFLNGDLAPGQYTIKLSSAGRFSDVGSYKVTLSPNKENWQWSNVGPVRVIQQANYHDATDVWTIDSSGDDLWSSRDHGTMAFQKHSGDVEIITQVTSQDDVHAWTKSGITIRDSLDKSAKHASVLLTPEHGTRMNFRKEAHQRTYDRAGYQHHTWLKLVRQGDDFISYSSADGINWQQISKQTLALEKTVYVGLINSSVKRRKAAKAQFANVSIQSLTKQTLQLNSELEIPEQPVINHYNDHQVSLTLSLPDNAQLQVEKSTDGLFFEPLAITSEQAFNDDNLLDGRPYFYRTRAIINNEMSAPSKALMLTTRVGPVLNPRLISYSEDTIILDWDEAYGETHYQIARASDNGEFKVIANAPKNRTKFIDTQLQPGTDYTYQITTFDKQGHSQTTTLVGATRLTPIVDFMPQHILKDSITLTWQANQNANMYLLERFHDETQSWFTLAELDANTVQYRDENLEPEHTYQYRISAQSHHSKTLKHSEATATTKTHSWQPPMSVTMSDVMSAQYPFNNQVGQQYHAHYWYGGAKSVSFTETGWHQDGIKALFYVEPEQQYQLEFVIENPASWPHFDLIINGEEVAHQIKTNNLNHDLHIIAGPINAKSNELSIHWRYFEPDYQMPHKRKVQKFVAIKKLN